MLPFPNVAAEGRYRDFGHESARARLIHHLGFTAGSQSFLFNPFSHVPRYGDRTYHRSLDFAFDEGKRYLDVEFASGLMRRAGQRCATLQVDDTICHGCSKTAPMTLPQVLGNDQVEILTYEYSGEGTRACCRCAR
jgi:hypothetical protein